MIAFEVMFKNNGFSNNDGSYVGAGLGMLSGMGYGFGIYGFKSSLPDGGEGLHSLGYGSMPLFGAYYGLGGGFGCGHGDDKGKCCDI